MANEIRATYDTGYVLYCLIYNAAGQVYYPVGATFEAYGTGGRTQTNYAVSLAGVGTTSQYRGTFPVVAAGVYSVVLFLQAGGGPLSTDSRIGQTAIMYWDGSAEITQNMMDTVLDTVADDVVNVDGIVPNSVVPDVAGTAATLHGITDGKVDAVKAETAFILDDTDLIDDGTNGLAAIKAEVEGIGGITPNAVVPDAAGVAAGLHATTDGKVDAVQATANTIAGDVVNIDGIVPNSVVPDVAGTAATLHGVTNGKVDAVQSDATAIKAKTDNLPTDPADASVIATAFGVTDGKVDAIQATVDTIEGYTDKIDDATNGLTAIKAEVEGIGGVTPNSVVPDAAGTAATLHGITDGKVDAVQTDVTTIKSYTDLIDDATNGLAKIATDVAAILVDTDVIDDATSGLVKIASDVAAILVDTGTTLPASLTAISNYVDTVETLLATISGYVDTLETSATTIAAYVDTVEATLALIKVKTDLITTGQIEISAPVAADGDVTIVRGDSYLDADSRALTWTSESWSTPSLTNATGKLRFISKADYDAGSNNAELEVTVAVTMDGTTATFKADLTAANTADLTASPPEDRYNYIYQVIVTTAGGSILTIALGSVYIKEDIAA